ncbi:hypothetical protein [Geomonas oryzae]|jgi:hypothetical protein|uniref:hypothetical protein n=1 Tax=Geomonas oryzae TaxID=2364273 RepID=UPI00100C14DD|nr:hypothetical protein [Geomonas oryzae]
MLVLDYLLVSLPFRGLVFKELGELRVVDYLLAQVLRIAMEISRLAPVRYVGLQPANHNLSAFYQRRDFIKLDKTDWLFTVLPKPSAASKQEK